MRHPTDGTLRRLVDEPAGVAQADREHVASCPACLSGLAAAQADAAASGAALHIEITPDVDAAWDRLTQATAVADRERADAAGSLRGRAGAADGLRGRVNAAGLAGRAGAADGLRGRVNAAGLAGRAGAADGLGGRAGAADGLRERVSATDRLRGRDTMVHRFRWRDHMAYRFRGRDGTARRWHTALRSPVVAVVGVVALLAGASAAAAADWLPIFRTEQITPVTAPQADLGKLPELSAFGDLDVTQEVKIREVDDVGAAEQATGLSVPRVGELPRGVTGAPTYHVAGRTTAVFTYSAEKAAQTAAAAGSTLPPPPAGLDGSQFRLAAGPGLAAVWSEGRPVPALIVARAVAPVAYSSGVPFATARDYLLSLPILPANVAAQLRGFSVDGTTLPLFVPTEKMTSSAAEVNGSPATVFASRDEVLAAVVWVRDGVVTAVAGSLRADEVLAVARGLRWNR